MGLKQISSEPTVWDGDSSVLIKSSTMFCVLSPPCGMVTLAQQYEEDAKAYYQVVLSPPCGMATV